MTAFDDSHAAMVAVTTTVISVLGPEALEAKPKLQELASRDDADLAARARAALRQLSK